jgi:glycosyltransferase involved in cell wall biosynthesis
MKVLFLTRFPPEKNGVGDYTYELASYLKKYCDIFVLTFGNRKVELINGIRVFRFILQNSFFKGYIVSKLIKALNKIFDFDLVHFQTASFCFDRNFYLFPLFLKDLNLVTTLHEVLTLRQFHYLPFVINVYRRSKRIIVLSLEEIKILTKLFRIRSSNIVWMHHGADVNVFNPNVSSKYFRERYDLGNSFVILTLGFIGPVKGYDVLIRSFKKVSGKMRDAKLVIAGMPRKETEWYFNYLKALVELFDLRDRVIFTGYIDYGLLPSCFASADIFVLPYKGGIQKSGPLHRALASGRVIVATDLPSVREVIKHGFNGFIVKPGDVNELANALLLLYKNEDLRKSLSSNARLFAENILIGTKLQRKPLKYTKRSSINFLFFTFD